MKKRFFLFLTSVCALLSIFSRCKDTPDPIPVVKVCDVATCTSWTGQECINGECLCIKGKRRLEGVCYGSDSTYIGAGKSNLWRDTAIFTIVKYETNTRFLSFNMEYWDKRGVPGQSGKTLTYRLKDAVKGDSIYEANRSDRIITRPDGSWLFPEFRGRILDSNTVRLRVTLCSYNSLGVIKERVDSTEYIFHKIQ